MNDDEWVVRASYLDKSTNNFFALYRKPKNGDWQVRLNGVKIIEEGTANEKSQLMPTGIFLNKKNVDKGRLHE